MASLKIMRPSAVTLLFWSTLLLLRNVPTTSAASAPKSVVPAKHVIGAGLGRTGTLSFKSALEMLPNVGPVFHMNESMASPDMFPLWEELTKLTPVPLLHGEPMWPPRLTERGSYPSEKDRRVELLRIILGVNQTHSHNIEYKQQQQSYNSAVDFPTCMYFRDMLDVYHNDNEDELSVKVVLTVRETGVTWAQSGLGSILNFMPCRRPFGIAVLFVTVPKLMKIGRMLTNTFARYFPTKTSGYDVESLAKMHDDWNDFVRATMQTYARDKGVELDEVFLEYQVKEGWEPLCEFLGYRGEDCPSDQPFPHLNDTKMQRKKWAFDNLLGYALVTVIVVFVGCALWIVRRFRTWMLASSRKNKKHKTV